MMNKSDKKENSGMGNMRQWMKTSFGISDDCKGKSGISEKTCKYNLPFSFIYDGIPFSTHIQRWVRILGGKKSNRNTIEYQLVYKDQSTGLLVQCKVVEYKHFPVVEWTLYFKNEGNKTTPIIESIHSIDVDIEKRNQSEFVLHHNRGDYHAPGIDMSIPDRYEPFATRLAPRSSKHFASKDGLPTDTGWPYFNIAWESEGIIAVIGWPGQWAASFTRDSQNNLCFHAGQETTRFCLHAGEQVRAPLNVLLFYQGDWIRGQNIWRRWMVAHNMPRMRNKTIKPMLFGQSGTATDLMVNANEANQFEFMDRYAEEKIRLDGWWMDAGWYPCVDNHWLTVGTWDVDYNRFPKGLKSISDLAHAKKMKTILWFHPEAVSRESWLYKNHPEWLLGLKDQQPLHYLLDLGNKAALQWLVEHISKLISEQGIDIYRQDFGINPLAFWREHDTENRRGITEIRHVEGYLFLWDELRRRHPGLLIDSCANGGRRNDLETLRRALPLWISDCAFVSIANQCHKYGLAFWLPYFGAWTKAGEITSGGALSVNPYIFWSDACASFGCDIDMRVKTHNYRLLRRLLRQWRKLAPYYCLGDYYPLTGYSMEKDACMAWQFDYPDKGKGIVQVFRREAAPKNSSCFKLQGLNPKSTYIIRDIDANVSQKTTGQILLEEGLPVNISARPGVAVFEYVSE